ncbi:uncharacterized protein LOC134882223 [Eleginops maclovinus]|uniref:uncharacterized protein LOC134882223 n=1 Tax=Eleginops maclovinus TaxID=56733 RepID=UPI0030809506
MTTGASVFLPSEYTSHFNSSEIRLYSTKLERLNISDPYNSPGVLFKSITSCSEDDVPDLRYADIHSYLVSFPSVYSGDSLRAYKSLEAYKWCQSGFVNNIQLWSLTSKNFGIITARVNHSQRLNESQLKPWVVVRNDGVVLGAHCNCTAGLGESCSHVSAVLFSLWGKNNARHEEISCTSKKCKWASPSEDAAKNVEYLQGKDIIFNHTQQNKKGNSTKGTSAPPSFPPLTAAEQTQFYQNLSQCRTQDGKSCRPAVLSVVRGYATSYVPKAVKLEMFLKILFQATPLGLAPDPGRVVFNRREERERQTPAAAETSTVDLNTQTPRSRASQETTPRIARLTRKSTQQKRAIHLRKESALLIQIREQTISGIGMGGGDGDGGRSQD